MGYRGTETWEIRIVGFRVSGFLESRRDGWMHGWMDGGREREGEGEGGRGREREGEGGRGREREGEGGRGREREGEGGREGGRRSLEGSGFFGCRVLNLLNDYHY